MTAWIEQFTKLGWELVFVFDAATGSTPEDVQFKFEELKKRFLSRISDTVAMHGYLHGGAPNQQHITRMKSLPRMSKRQALRVFEEVGVSSFTCLQEADMELMQLLVERPEAYAIVASDSDFLVAEGSRYMPFEYIETTDKIGADGIMRTTTVASLFTPALLAAALSLSANQLPTLAALCGNDFTAGYLPALYHDLGLKSVLLPDGRGKRSLPKDVASWMLRTNTTEPGDHAVLKRAIASSEDLKQCLEFSARFYGGGMRRSAAPLIQTDADQLMVDELQRSAMPSWVCAVRWCRSSRRAPAFFLISLRSMPTANAEVLSRPQGT